MRNRVQSYQEAAADRRRDPRRRARVEREKALISAEMRLHERSRSD